ncbi:CRP-like cAMP-binding protein [Deinobacterium chartae]|uniref:CRP-like cAMP-binding protein n=1 Tax=Deinobacterium chartae TaxID=521158 RepID=A0A841HZK8_9DEIO|nr:Crp/Fnr family transcriptional regulator [Deinobacterium chartae]MBB6097640.1 CRP-like cAMP-binding protein [Deinobacterium chartae]
MNDILQDLAASPLFENVRPEALEAARQVAIVRNFSAGDVMLGQEADGETLYLLASGAVTVERSSITGQERVLNYLYAPALIGEIAVVLDGQRSATVRCVTDVRALMFYRDPLRSVIDRHPQVLWNLARVLGQRVRDLNDELLIVTFSSTEACVAYALYSLYRQRQHARLENAAVLEMSHQELANRSGNSRESVSRALRKFEAAGLIRSRARRLEIMNVEGLEAVMYGLDDD